MTVSLTHETPASHFSLTKSDEQEPSSLLPRLIAASIGSIAVALVVTPLEVVKVRQQAGRIAPPLPPNNASLCPRGCGTFVLNNGMMDCLLPKSCVPYFDAQGQFTEVAKKVVDQPGTFGYLRRIFLHEGTTGIYAGLAPTLVMSVPNTVLYFTAYDEIVASLRHRIPHSESSSIWIPLFSGASARALASIVTAPLELIRTRQASLVGQRQPTPTLYNEFRTMIRQGGILSLYRGLTPTLWRDAPFSAIYWLGIEKLKLLWKQHNNNNNTAEPAALVAAGQSFVNGAVAGMIAAAATTPFDVIKTRRQIVDMIPSTTTNTISSNGVTCHHHHGAMAYKHNHQDARGIVNTRTTGTFHFMRQLVKEEGWSALWRGNQTRMIKVAPACAIMISCYEFGKRVME